MPLQHPAPTLKPVAQLTIHLAPIEELGESNRGRRRIIPITGGTVRGERINGEILPVGADWQTVTADGTAWLDARYAIRTDDGALIEIHNVGLRHGPDAVMSQVAAGEAVDPAQYYMRTQARLETGHPDYLWVNRCLFVGTGGRLHDQVSLSLYEVC
tara:strand:- start:244 stop:714 length:471 start_codon:yes stop_codon:yes gene_type:complete